MQRIGLSFGRLATFNDGLSEFSLQLGQGLAARAPALKDQGISLSFHLRPQLHGLFGDDVGYLAVKGMQRFWHTQPQHFDVWHLLHQHNSYRYPRGTGCKLLTVHDLNFYYFKTEAKIRKYARRTQALLDQADALVTISDFVRQDLEARLKPRSAITVIHNGARDFSPHEQAAIDGVQAPFFLHLSRMAPNKNIDAILRLAQVWPESRWLLAGGADEAMVRSLKTRMAELGLRNVALRTDITDAQKAWAYAQCQGFVFPSLTEGFGLPPIEAMQFGKPVFLSNRTCLPEIGGELANYFDSFDPVAMREVMVRGMQRFEADPAGMATALRQHAQGFSWEAVVDKHVALYRRLLGRT